MPKGDLLLFIAVMTLALLFAEMQVRRVVSSRYVCVALIWIILVGMLIWAAFSH